VYRVGPLRWSGAIDGPDWLVSFVKKVDAGTPDTNITARTCLRTLDAVP
jgi:hypothetical protein